MRFHASASDYHSNSRATLSSSSSDNSKWAYSCALFHAIAYEIQPFRIRPCLHRAKIFVCEEEGLKHLSASILEYAKSVFSVLKELFQFLHKQFQQMDIDSVKSFFVSNKSFLAKSTTILFALRIYYHVLLYLHDLLHAGPIIVILTLMTLLYTIGLGNNTGAGSGIPSAYSVFNRGMRKIMGTVDGEELARQYAGGAMMAGMNNDNAHRHNRNDEFEDGNDIWLANEEEDTEGEEEERNLVNERRRRRRLERLQQQQRNADEGGNEGNDNNRREQPGDENDGGAPHPDENEEMEEDGAPELAEEARPPANGTAEATATAGGRKSGKKARRRNLELRREIQRQRQAAAAMGFVGGDMENANDGREFEARMALD